MLDSSLYDFAKSIVHKWAIIRKQQQQEPPADDVEDGFLFKVFADQCFQEWCSAFPYFDRMRAEKVEYSSSRQYSFQAYMKQNVNKILCKFRNGKGTN